MINQLNLNSNSWRFVAATIVTISLLVGGGWGAIAKDTSLTAEAGLPESSIKLLTAKFESRQVAQVEVGDFHFKPGQIAPIHTHIAPAIGYVAKGAIIYQIEGERPQILRAGDAFYEPAGPRILRFDNRRSNLPRFESGTDQRAFHRFRRTANGGD